MPTRSSPEESFPEPGTTRLSVPGKLILMGEHAVVYRRPALVAAIGLRLTVTLQARPGADVVLELPALGFSGSLSWDEIASRTAVMRAAWEAWSREPTATRFAALRSGGAVRLVALALGEAAAELADRRPPGLWLRIDSEIPVGTGFGSSSATAVAVAAGYLACRGAAADPARIDRIALEVDRRQHGLPSGVDHRTVLRGGLLWAEPDAALALRLAPVRPGSPALLRCLRVYDSGPAGESTGAVVAAVRERVSREPARHEALFDRIARATTCLRECLVAARPQPSVVRESIRAAGRALEELGVVPPAVRELVREIESRGGAAKISGAGSLSGDGAGCLLVYHEAPDVLDGLARLDGLPRHVVPLGVEGLRAEAA